MPSMMQPPRLVLPAQGVAPPQDERGVIMSARNLSLCCLHSARPAGPVVCSARGRLEARAALRQSGSLPTLRPLRCVERPKLSAESDACKEVLGLVFAPARGENRSCCGTPRFPECNGNDENELGVKQCANRPLSSLCSNGVSDCTNLKRQDWIVNNEKNLLAESKAVLEVQHSARAQTPFPIHNTMVKPRHCGKLKAIAEPAFANFSTQQKVVLKNALSEARKVILPGKRVTFAEDDKENEIITEDAEDDENTTTVKVLRPHTPWAPSVPCRHYAQTPCVDDAAEELVPINKPDEMEPSAPTGPCPLAQQRLVMRNPLDQPTLGMPRRRARSTSALRLRSIIDETRSSDQSLVKQAAQPVVDQLVTSKQQDTLGATIGFDTIVRKQGNWVL